MAPQQAGIIPPVSIGQHRPSSPMATPPRTSKPKSPHSFPSSRRMSMPTPPQQPTPPPRWMQLQHPPPTSMPLVAVLLLLSGNGSPDPNLNDSHNNNTNTKNSASNVVYLMDPLWLERWIRWAFGQPVPATEQSRLREACRLVALRFGVPLPDVQSYQNHARRSTPKDDEDYDDDEYDDNNNKNGNHSDSNDTPVDPSPIDATRLSVPGHALLLNMRATIPDDSSSVTGAAARSGSPLPSRLSSDKASKSQLHIPIEAMRTLSLNAMPPSGRTSNNNSSTNDPLTDVACVAVPHAFYELVRRVHGVLCDDGHAVSFQAADNPERLILHHHVFHNTATTTAHHKNGSRTSSIVSTAPRPIEFPRRIVHHVREAPQRDAPVLKKNTPKKQFQAAKTTSNSTRSLMETLLLEEQARTEAYVVEVHPCKLLYSIDAPTASSSSVGATSTTKQHHHDGFVLISRDVSALDALAALQRVAAPGVAAEAVRVWSRHDYRGGGPSSQHNNNNSIERYELVDMDYLNDTQWTVGQWMQQHSSNRGGAEETAAENGGGDTDGDLHGAARPTTRTNLLPELELSLQLETRSATIGSAWPRQSETLAQRLSVGDLCDAQDVTGKWYEAVVRKVATEGSKDGIDKDTVVVHFVGWASRWDAKVRRERIVAEAKEEDGAAGTLTKGLVAPLWSMAGRWREQLQPGDSVEVRDSSSIVERPKWYQGIVQRVGGVNDKPRDLAGGAALETYEDDKPLLIFNRIQQILVQIEQERNGGAHGPNSKDFPALNTDATIDSLASSTVACPPVLRWVNLYGEEICKTGTHLKQKDMGPVTLRYEFDANRKPVEVMKAHPMHGSGFMRESLRGTPPAPGSVGLHNLGNSCFLNSTVQCLNHIEPLTQFFLQGKYSNDLNKRNPLGSGGNVAVAFASLLKKMWGGHHSVLVPRLLKQTVANFAPQFDNSYQHDSHEFCQFLMDGLHEDLNRVKTKPYVEELEGFGMADELAAIESWRKHLLRHDSVVVDHCQGMHRSHLTCPQCARESIKFDVYSSISLPLLTDKNTTANIKLEDCIEKFMEAEQLDERDAYYCANCRRHVCALKLIALWSVPDILIIHLKRFTFSGMMSGGMLRSKVDNTVEFPINGLDLTKEVLGPIDPEAPPIYNLFGVSEHSGPTANSGHYTATVRNSIDGQWYRCNDSHVGITSGEASITGGAYLLFYQRAKGITKWGGMHKAMKDRGIDPYGGLDPLDKEGFKPVKNKRKKREK